MLHRILKLIVCLLFNFFVIAATLSQNTETQAGVFSYKNSVQTELFGHGLIYSINFERIILNRPIFNTSGQAGFSYYPAGTGLIRLWLPVLFNEIVSFNNNHHAECGLGYVFREDVGEWDGLLTCRLGYRYQNPTERLVIRLAFTPFFEIKRGNGNEDSKNTTWYPSGGISVGYCF